MLVVCPEIDTKSRGTVEFLIKEVHLLEDPHQCDDDKRENNVLKNLIIKYRINGNKQAEVCGRRKLWVGGGSMIGGGGENNTALECK